MGQQGQHQTETVCVCVRAATNVYVSKQVFDYKNIGIENRFVSFFRHLTNTLYGIASPSHKLWHCFTQSQTVTHELSLGINARVGCLSIISSCEVQVPFRQCPSQGAFF